MIKERKIQGKRATNNKSLMITEKNPGKKGIHCWRNDTIFICAADSHVYRDRKSLLFFFSFFLSLWYLEMLIILSFFFSVKCVTYHSKSTSFIWCDKNTNLNLTSEWNFCKGRGDQRPFSASNLRCWHVNLKKQLTNPERGLTRWGLLPPLGNNKKRFLWKTWHFLNKTCSLAKQLFTELIQRLLETLPSYNPQTSHQLPWQMLQTKSQPCTFSIAQVKFKIINHYFLGFTLFNFKAKPNQNPGDQRG